eukprot:m51a1_g13106 hypothetical protein (328) ;mRNA; r:539-2425
MSWSHDLDSVCDYVRQRLNSETQNGRSSFRNAHSTTSFGGAWHDNSSYWRTQSIDGSTSVCWFECNSSSFDVPPGQYVAAWRLHLSGLDGFSSMKGSVTVSGGNFYRVASAAEKRPSSARPRSAIKKVLCSVEYNGKKFRVTVPLRTVDAAIETICESTSADAASSVIETFDPELDDWFVFNSIDMLVDKGKVRILAKKGAGQARRPEWRGAQRMSAPVEEQLALRDYLKFPPGYTPKNSCAKELLANSDVLGLVDVSQLIQSCTEFIDDLRFSDPEELKYVNTDELFAIVAYTYDLGYAKPEDNLYFKINVDLRGRMGSHREGIPV